MPNCHACLTHKEIVKGVYRHTPFNEIPCARCTLADDPSHKGRSHVSRDASDAVVVDESTQEMPIRDIDPQLEKLADFVMQFMALPSVTRDVVAFRFVHPDKPLKDVAAQHNITMQAAHSRLKRALERFPVLSEVITMRTGGRHL